MQELEIIYYYIIREQCLIYGTFFISAVIKITIITQTLIDRQPHFLIRGRDWFKTNCSVQKKTKI